MSEKFSATVKSETAIPLPALEVFNGPAASAVTKNSETLAKGMQDTSTQFGEFVSSRIEANVELYTQCRECTDWAGLMDAQQKWLQNTSQAYSDQANSIISMTQSMFKQSENKPVIPGIKTTEKTQK
ncbi:MAG: phasin family protein [Thalassospira sp.]|uniref:phasin family protein n=1 Tax=Thalassospira sp. TaxID=1912094 RepID=UPI0032EC5F1A